MLQVLMLWTPQREVHSPPRWAICSSIHKTSNCIQKLKAGIPVNTKCPNCNKHHDWNPRCQAKSPQHAWLHCLQTKPQHHLSTKTQQFSIKPQHHLTTPTKPRLLLSMQKTGQLQPNLPMIQQNKQLLLLKKQILLYQLLTSKTHLPWLASKTQSQLN